MNSSATWALEMLVLSITKVEGKLFDFLDLLIIYRRIDQVCFESVLNICVINLLSSSFYFITNFVTLFIFTLFGLFSFLRNTLSLFIDDIISPFVTQCCCFISFFLTF